MSLLLDALKKAAKDKIARSDFEAHSDPKGESQDGSQYKIARSDSGARSDPKGESQDGSQYKIARSDSGARSDPKGESQDGSQYKIARSDSGAHSDPKRKNRDGPQHISTRGDPPSVENDGTLDTTDVTLMPVMAESASLAQQDADIGTERVSGSAKPMSEEFEFTLDDQPVQAAPETVAEAATEPAYLPKADTDPVAIAKAETASIAAMHTTVTDEALQLLIHNTNTDHRKRQFAVWGGVFSGSILILMLAGMYFYIGMEDEIEAMQRKNRQALAALEAQTRIEENLTSLATPVSPPVAQPVRSDPDAGFKTAARKPFEQAPRQKQTFTVQKTERDDPVNMLLNRGWSSFQRGEYDIASKAYADVLQREARNRDALMGLAAVASKRGETEKARETYLRLLELDPIDPHAHAGLAYIAQSEGASLSESRLRQLIEKQPDGAHLQFVLGNLYAQQNKWPQAQQEYFSAWQADSENADYAFNLAVSLDHLKKYPEAERFYRRSMELAQNGKTGFTADAVEKRLQQLRAVKQ